MDKQVLVVGGGASGLTAAIAAARHGADVTVLERMDRAGKKILSTGNGKCNLTNLYLDEHCYRSSNCDFPMQALANFLPADTMEFFKEMGLLFKIRDGYVYPFSQQASSVLNALRMELDRLKVSLVCGCQVERIYRMKSRKSGQQAFTGFRVRTSLGDFCSKQVILSAGSKAAPVTGSDGSGYGLASELGHSLVKPLPALVQLRCRGWDFKQVAGVRTDAGVELWSGGRKLAYDQGELQLTDYGISGIPVFQVSRFASIALDQGHKVEARLDFMPHMPASEWELFFRQRVRQLGNRTGEHFLNGVLNQKLALWLLKAAGFRLDLSVAKQPEAVNGLSRLVKCCRIPVSATNSFSQAQICCGGVDTSQIDPLTMESRLVPGLYITGELLDVDGICGGYNLQWAWATGYMAGKAAAGPANTKNPKNSSQR